MTGAPSRQLDSRRRPLPWLWLRLRVRVTLCVGLIAMSWLLPATWIESLFSDSVFPVTQRVLVPLSGFVPLPIMGCFLVVGPIGLFAWAWWGWRRSRAAGKSVAARLGAGSLRGVRLGLYLYTAFLVVWGFGYRRESVADRWGLEDRPASLSEVRLLQSRLVALIRRDCVADAARDRGRARRSIEVAQADLVEELEGFRPAWPAHIKSPPGGLLLRIDVAGVVSPWTLEAHVDDALPVSQWVAVCGHELAHLAGYCGEADANLVGFVSGLRADDAFARYCTALRLFQYTWSQAAAVDYLAAYDALPARARQDLAAGRAARKQYVIAELKEVSSAIYDRYLESQGVTEGVGDYARGFRLFVRAWARGMVRLPAGR